MMGAGIKIVLFAAILTMGSVAAKPVTTITAQQFLEMNSTYREGLILGMLSSWVVFGVSEQYEDAWAGAMKCQAETAPKARAPEITLRFGQYLDSHPDLKNSEVPFAFLSFLLECQK